MCSSPHEPVVLSRLGIMDQTLGHRHGIAGLRILSLSDRAMNGDVLAHNSKSFHIFSFGRNGDGVRVVNCDPVAVNCL